MDYQLNNFWASYAILENHIQLALHTQPGDWQHLEAQCEEALHFLQSAEQVCILFSIQVKLEIKFLVFKYVNIFPPAELFILKTSISDMVDALEDACLQSADPLHLPPLVVTHCNPQGKHGRLHVQIDETFLEFAIQLRGSSGIASELGCSACTVQCHALEQGLVNPGNPVYIDEHLNDGSVHHIWYSANPSETNISDEDLDQEMLTILRVFPNFGRRIISGDLQSKGIQVVCDWVRASYLQVHGAPAIFGERCITQCIYSVPGVNSLWHHDGQQGSVQSVNSKIMFLTLLRFNLLETSNTCLH